MLVFITDGAGTREVFDHISKAYPIIKSNLYKMDNEEILLMLENNVRYNFSLNELRATVAEVATAEASVICVDLSEPAQRYI